MLAIDFKFQVISRNDEEADYVPTFFYLNLCGGIFMESN
jgi:hypothetical protein